MNLPGVTRWLTGRARPAGRPARARTPLGTHGIRASRLLLVLFGVGLLTYFSPGQRPYSVLELPVGSVAPGRINAPLPFFVRKSAEDLDREQREAESAVPTILLSHAHTREAQQSRLDAVLDVLVPNIRMQMPDSLKHRRLQRELPAVIGSLSETALQNLTQALSQATPEAVVRFVDACLQLHTDIYSTGVVPSKDESVTGLTRQVRIGDREQLIDLLFDAESLKREQILSLIEGYPPIVEMGATEAVHELLGLFIVPSLTVDVVETTRLRAEARRSVASIKRRYLQDEMIIDKNTKVDPEHVEALASLASHLTQEERKDPVIRYLQTGAAAVIAAFIVVALAYYLSTREREIYDDLGSLVLLAIISLSTAATATFIHTHEWPTYWVPTPLAAMLITILLNPQVGLVVSFLLALFVGSLFGDFHAALICGLTSSVAVYSVRNVRHRNQFYRPMVLVPISYALLIGAADVLRFVKPEQIAEHVPPGVIVGVISPILIQGLLPIFESLFNITTDITLLELSDLNRPLLRELAIRAPGTYTHSLIMANLSEPAAETVGANALLARVGCYYHDIGKMLKPEYFSENQGLKGGRNPHDHLTPSMSMLIIDSHVKDGIELAEENGLPKSIVDLIPQHHGTSVIEYFYNRAVELGVENVRRDDFRYDGPKPQTKEGGILMLADSVESAARTLVERTPNRVRQLVRRIVQQKFTAGQLDECPLTLRDLHGIEGSFIPVLMGSLHERPEYPWQRKERQAGASSVHQRRS